MKGSYDVKVWNRRVQYKFTIRRNLTILRGDSATGKTTLIDLIASYQANGAHSGVSVQCDKPCVVLSALNWEQNLSLIQNSIVFIDEGDPFVATKEFARAAQKSNNYYVIATRASLFNLPYSVTEIYGIRNISGNLYEGTKRLYSQFYPLYTIPSNNEKPDLVIVEDAHSGFEFFSKICSDHGIQCISAKGKSNIYPEIVKRSHNEKILVIADGAAFGPEIERVVALRNVRSLSIYLPESFEWIILKSGVIPQRISIKNILESPSAHIESSEYFSWEQFFSAILIQITNDTYLKYQKSTLNPVYLQKKESEKILDVIAETTSAFLSPIEPKQ
ncbi:translation initiation factor 2 [Allofournierella massiliensis]|uniref:translation initiation factor 2 n=1 Tax=Allofournierella massiliensis TaxID=1650663 RepID=UPI003561F424